MGIIETDTQQHLRGLRDQGPLTFSGRSGLWNALPSFGKDPRRTQRPVQPTPQRRPFRLELHLLVAHLPTHPQADQEPQATQNHLPRQSLRHPLKLPLQELRVHLHRLLAVFRVLPRICQQPFVL
jgi:hypothetical protein